MSNPAMNTAHRCSPLQGEGGENTNSSPAFLPVFARKGRDGNSNNHYTMRRKSPVSPLSPYADIEADFDASKMLAKIFKGEPSAAESDAHCELFYIWAERAGILEFEGGLTRQQAERRATEILQKDNP